VRQILLNLVSNAAKFTEAGEIVVAVSVQSDTVGAQELRISVKDTGPGISPDDQAKLFQAFSQVDDSPTRKTGGSGLGLSISQQLVQMHGGRIGVDSAPGKGSTFYFTLPVYQAGLETSAKGARVVLAVDDDPQVIQLYERYLEPQGYQVVGLTDPTRAKQRALEMKPFAITLDIMMPGYDGWQVLSELKSDAETRTIPVIVCSILEQQERGFSLGAADYVLKPILGDGLVKALDRLNRDRSIREVLIVDDDADSRRLIEKTFQAQREYRLVLAGSGEEGWKAIKQHAPDAVIINLFMPDMDGFTLLEKLRDHAGLRHVPVVVISDRELSADQQQQLTDFGHRLIRKSSLHEKDLLETMQRALQRVRGPV
jgi:CheY-like chemotaxis protein